jgi:DASH complex subunit ASK1
MSRPSSVASARNLTLTEELEKLEQSITLTLQEIDHNFSRAHRIVTGSILPVVEQYAKHSEAVWEGSRFWKQFFEASANVSLSGYEETQQEQSVLEDETDQTATETTTTDATDTTTTQDESAISYQAGEEPSHLGAEDSTVTMTPPTATKHTSHVDVEDSFLSSPTGAGAHSTPRMPPSVGKKPTPYSDVTKTLFAAQASASSDAPTTPRTQQDTTFASSPFELPSTSRKSTATATKHTSEDPLLHRMLDKTYRIAATPHRTMQPPPSILRSGKQRAAQTPATATKTTRWQLDDSPMSSPEIQAPQLRADIFNTPGGKGATPGKGRPLLSAGERTPGVSVQTPGKTWGGRYTQNTLQGGQLDDETRRTLWDDDSDDELDFSPPKTMQFHIPQNKLLQTPGKSIHPFSSSCLFGTWSADIQANARPV